MQHFGGQADGQSVKPVGFLIVEHVFPTPCAEEARQNGADGAGHLTECTGSPIGGKPAIHAADKAGNDARRPAE